MLTAILMRIAYGIKVQESGDKYIGIVEKANEVPIEAGIPGAFLVDIFPIRTYPFPIYEVYWNSAAVKYVPSWVPGASFKLKARESRIAMYSLLEVPFAAAKQNLV